MNEFPLFIQESYTDCGPTCLRMIAAFHGVRKSQKEIAELFHGENYASLNDIVKAAKTIGFNSFGVKTSFQKLLYENPLPCIIHWNQLHFVVLYSIDKSTVLVADPGQGIVGYNAEEFINKWIGTDASENTKEGIALLIIPDISVSSF